MNSVEQKELNIKVKTLDNSLYEFSVTKETSINDLKDQIAAKLNVPSNRQRIIFQGKMLKNHDSIGSYKIEDGHVLHLVANTGLQDQERETNTQSQQQNNNTNREVEASPLAESIADLELISGLIRTLSETSFNRRNLRRRLLQQRTNGFNMDVIESLEIIRQNIINLETMLNSTIKPNEVTHMENGYVNPFNFSLRKLSIGQWVDVKDTIDQWLEAQVINVRDNQAYIHYNGWGSRWDEWIDMNSPRIALFRTHTVQSSNNTIYMSPFPNNTLDGDNTHIPRHHNDFPDQLEDIGRMMSSVSSMTQKLVNRLNPAQSLSKSEKSEKHSNAKHDMELQNVISGMIEEQKCQPLEREAKSEKYVQFEDTTSVKSHKSMEKNVLFEDAQSVKSHKSLDYDAISLKSIKSFMSTSDIKTGNPPLNFPEYISEEDSEEISEIQTNVHIPHPNQLRELQISLLASQLAPLYDRLGRLLIDMSPHLAMLGSATQTLNNGQNTLGNPSTAPNNPNLTFASILTNESGQTASNLNNSNNRQFSFQVPVMLTPGEIMAANNATSSSRLLGENNNVEFHIHAILGPLRNTRSNQINMNSNSHHNPVTHSMQLGSPIRVNHETRPPRSEPAERRESQRRIHHPYMSESHDRRRCTQPIQHHTNSQQTIIKETEKISLEKDSQQKPRLIKEREEENLNEISFGTRRDVDNENDNIFADSDTNSQGRNHHDMEIEMNTRSANPIRSRVSHDEDDNLFRTPRQSISSDRNEYTNPLEKHIDTKTEIKDFLEKEDLNHKIEVRNENDNEGNSNNQEKYDEENEENDEEESWNRQHSRRSNCGRNIS